MYDGLFRDFLRRISHTLADSGSIIASLNKLTVKQIQSLKAVNGKSIRKSDGGGLYIYVKGNYD